jgi:hypothetical protein
VNAVFIGRWRDKQSRCSNSERENHEKIMRKSYEQWQRNVPPCLCAVCLLVLRLCQPIPAIRSNDTSTERARSLRCLFASELFTCSTRLQAFRRGYCKHERRNSA